MMHKALEKKYVGVGEPVCLWAQAGVVRHKTCRLDFECPSCAYDRAMRRAVEQNRSAAQSHRGENAKKPGLVFWKDRLNAWPPGKRPCIHHMKGRIEFRSCNHAYTCHDCEFDQYFTDQLAVHAAIRPIGELNIEGFKIPQGFYLHEGHAWVRVEEGGEVRVGMDDFIHRVMGPFDRVVAPLVGKSLRRNTPAVAVERGPHCAHMIAPVNGVVTAINAAVLQDGRPASRDPYAGGWIMRIHADDIRQDLKCLMLGNETIDFYKKENAALHAMIEKEARPMAVDGGFLADDLFGKMPRLGWERLAGRFLRS